jgi:hypothetical protein
MLQSMFSKLALCAATGALAAAAMAAPAAASDPVISSDQAVASDPAAAYDPTVAYGPTNASDMSVNAPYAYGGGDWSRHWYKGRVIARSGLLLRDAPTRNSRVVGWLPYGDIVHIRCKVNGDRVDGNPRWYLLSNGQWAWASARYIVNIGAAPAWC